jgi:predicted nucleic acid-binding protein
MPTGKPIIYWDSCVFLSWIKDEKRPNDEMDGVNEVAQNVFKDHVILLTSDITIGEILDSTLDDVAKQKLKDIFKRRNCRSVAADRRVNSLASEIRDYYQQQKTTDYLPTLTLPDAIHLATAIIYSASEFHTFDANDERNRRRAILPLNGNVAGHPLKICKPPLPPQMPLFEKSIRRLNLHEG